MKEIILEYLNDEFKFTAGTGVNNDDINSVFSISNNNQKIGFHQIETIIIKVFNLDEDIAHAIVFNWLLYNGVKLVRKNWNKTYMIYNKNNVVEYERTLTEDIDFEYKLIPNG